MSDYSEIFNSQVFLSQPPDPNADKIVSKGYNFVAALEKLKGKESFELWLGDECSAASKRLRKVNIAAFFRSSHN